mmetsp:Transcript_95937/g.260449  ORF Transcript_95937/g.260449 Transcript_95937/m.260449 type:complete len:210 (-) Transcript_95937:1281-1910(-)
MQGASRSSGALWSAPHAALARAGPRSRACCAAERWRRRSGRSPRRWARRPWGSCAWWRATRCRSASRALAKGSRWRPSWCASSRPPAPRRPCWASSRPGSRATGSAPTSPCTATPSRTRWWSRVSRRTPPRPSSSISSPSRGPPRWHWRGRRAAPGTRRHSSRASGRSRACSAAGSTPSRTRRRRGWPRCSPARPRPSSRRCRPSPGPA